MDSLFPNRALGYFYFHTLLLFFCSTTFRIYLFTSLPTPDVTSLLETFGFGLLFDCAAALYSFLPIAVLIVVTGLLRRSWTNFFSILAFVELFFFLLLTLCEFFFFQEFRDRFNFIAVDYLVYTNEVMRNIWESYRLIPILSTLFCVCALAALLFHKYFGLNKKHPLRLLPLTGSYALLTGFFFFFLNEATLLGKANDFVDVVSKNGLHALFAAYRNNEINYERFYTDMDVQAAGKIVHDSINAGTDSNSSSVIHEVKGKGSKKYNLVFILMESLSARFMGAYGSPHGLTPYLDRYAKEGLFFDQLYATGTRTVRGLEAVLLSIPPTPGQSIVRRPGGTKLFNLGSVFRQNGYSTTFIYGGRAVFDNMRAFFEGNGFGVEDQSTFPKSEIGFANAWGVSDEDLLTQALNIADRSYTHKENFFHFILNTSNHRPYTYPTGKINIPPKTGRDGAVKYSDYAIGQYIEAARKKPWFNDTIFVFLADHNASVAGGTTILPYDYLIPFIVYAPKHLKPRKVSGVSSQIDVAPTLAGIFQFHYQSKFFGVDLLKEKPERAFLGTYQKVALLKNQKLAVLSPNQKIEVFDWNGQKLKLKSEAVIKKIETGMDPLVTQAVAFYKTASYWFTNQLLEEK